MPTPTWIFFFFFASPYISLMLPHKQKHYMAISLAHSPSSWLDPPPLPRLSSEHAHVLSSSPAFLGSQPCLEDAVGWPVTAQTSLEDPRAGGLCP